MINKIGYVLIAIGFSIFIFILFRQNYFKKNIDSQAQTEIITQENSNQAPSQKIPDYSKIEVRGISKMDRIKGNGASFKADAKVTFTYDVFIYDPAKLSNKGDRLSLAGMPFRITTEVGSDKDWKVLSDYFSGLKENGIRQILIPFSEAKNFHFFRSPPNGAIVMVEIELAKVESN
jgi:hypothetical protein